MAIEALNAHIDSVAERNAVYQRRRDRVVGVLRGIGIEVETPRASLYVWARVPGGYTSAQFTEALLEERDIVVTPGTGYGEQGEGYVRLSADHTGRRDGEGPAPAEHLGYSAGQGRLVKERTDPTTTALD